MGMTFEEFEEYAISHNILPMTREFYETRLKVDMVAMLMDLYILFEDCQSVDDCFAILNRHIADLKGDSDGA